MWLKTYLLLLNERISLGLFSTQPLRLSWAKILMLGACNLRGKFYDKISFGGKKMLSILLLTWHVPGLTSLDLTCSWLDLTCSWLDLTCSWLDLTRWWLDLICSWHVPSLTWHTPDLTWHVPEMTWHVPDLTWHIHDLTTVGWMVEMSELDKYLK